MNNKNIIEISCGIEHTVILSSEKKKFIYYFYTLKKKIKKKEFGEVFVSGSNLVK